MISIIIPVYNTEPYLGKCIRSVRDQTYKDWECIIINDGSTDGSKELLEKIVGEDKRFTLISQPNMGISTARNNAMFLARGEMLFFVDSDDWLEPDAIGYLVSVAQTNPDMGRIVGLAIQHYPDKGWNIPWPIEPYGIHFPNGPHMFSGPECDPGHVTGSLYIRKNIPDDLLFPKAKIFEDMIFNMGIMFSGASSLITKKYIYHYVRRGDSAISSQLTDDEADEARMALDDFRDRYAPNKEVYERCRRFLENALINKTAKK